MRKLLHALVAVATFTVAWLVVSPAYAWTSMAPVCDPRGATIAAPPPQIQDANQSLDIVDDCGADASSSDTKNLVRGHAPQIEISSSQEPVAAAATSVSALAFVERAAFVLRVEAPPKAAQRDAIERPPRA
jgi:hypothetical protein